jgi:hypothetical protein
MGRKEGQGCSRNEGTGDWKKLCDEGLHDLYSSINILGLNKSWRMSWQRHVGSSGRRKIHKCIQRLGG